MIKISVIKITPLFYLIDQSDSASDQLLARAVEMQERDFRRKQEEREFQLLKVNKKT